MGQFFSVSAAHDMDSWFDVGACTRFSISFITRDHTIGTPRSELPILRRWAVDNLKGDVVYGEGNEGGVGREYYLYLSDSEDIIIFKLSKWYNEELNQPF